MDLRDVEHVLAVCRTLNFTRAAEQCGVTQPTLTRAVQKLERELGGPLFARERGRTHLTALGRLVRPRLEELLAQERTLRQQARQHQRLQGGELRLGVMCSIGPARLGALLQRFRAQQPGIEVTLADATPAELLARLMAGEVDAALTLAPEQDTGRLRAEPLYAERYVVACAAGHPFAERRSITMRDMDGQTYLSRIRCEHRDVLGEALQAAGARIVVACRSEREDWIQGLVAAGMGVCFLPEFGAVQPGLLLRPVEDAPIARHVCLVTVAGRRWSPQLAGFIETLRRTPPAEAA